MDKSYGKACWNCGQVNDLRFGFCGPCTIANYDYMMIDCVVCESVAQRRRFRGQQYFTCKSCKIGVGSGQQAISV